MTTITQPIYEDDVNWLLNKAQMMVRVAVRKLKLSRLRQYEHWEDLQQTALCALCQVPEQPVAVACSNAYFAVCDYIMMHIYQRQTGWKLAASKAYHHTSLEAYANEETGEILLSDTNQSRPTEEAIVRYSEQGEKERFWQEVVHCFLQVLVGMREKWQAESLYAGAQILALSCQGLSTMAIALTLQMDEETVNHLKYHYRQELEKFLSLGTVVQGVLQARGVLHCYRHHELTAGILNGGYRYIVIFPHGAFSVYVHHKKQKDGSCKIYGSVQRYQRIDGKLKGKKRMLGRVGQITYDILYAATMLLM